MFKRKLTAGDLFLLIANLVPIFGALFLGWSPEEIFLVYCLETLIVGMVNLLKMAVVTVIRPRHDWPNQGTVSKQHGLFFMLFFLLHYGIFAAVQMGIFFGVSGIRGAGEITLGNFFYQWPHLLTPEALIMLIAFAISYGIKAIFDFILSNEYQTISMMQLMFQPYGRIFIQQIVVIIGSMFLLLGAGSIFLVVFALVKIFFTLTIDYEGLIRKAASGINPNNPNKT